MKSLPILSRHSSLAEAVAAAGLDLSYNEPLARAEISSIDLGPLCKQTFVVKEDGASVVYFEYICDVRLLNRYTPFHSCLHDGKFCLVVESGENLIFTDGLTADRNAIRSATQAHPTLWANK